MTRSSEDVEVRTGSFTAGKEEQAGCAFLTTMLNRPMAETDDEKLH